MGPRSESPGLHSSRPRIGDRRRCTLYAASAGDGASHRRSTSPVPTHSHSARRRSFAALGNEAPLHANAANRIQAIDGTGLAILQLAIKHTEFAHLEPRISPVATFFVADMQQHRELGATF